jgi:hypothetical protein
MNRIVRPRLTCTCCECFVQAPLPSRPIERGRPGPGLLAHMLVSKYADHPPLYRQSQIFDREGLDLDCIHRSEGFPVAEEAINRIAQLYAIEKEARGSSPNVRVERRKSHAAPVFDDLKRRLARQFTAISPISPLAAAIHYALTHMERLRPYLDHGILEPNNNAAERGMRSRPRSQELPLRRLLCGRKGCRHRLHPDRDSQSERNRSERRARRHSRPHPRLQDHKGR